MACWDRRKAAYTVSDHWHTLQNSQPDIHGARFDYSWDVVHMAHGVGGQHYQCHHHQGGTAHGSHCRVVVRARSVLFQGALHDRSFSSKSLRTESLVRISGFQAPRISRTVTNCLFHLSRCASKLAQVRQPSSRAPGTGMLLPLPVAVDGAGGCDPAGTLTSRFPERIVSELFPVLNPDEKMSPCPNCS